MHSTPEIFQEFLNLKRKLIVFFYVVGVPGTVDKLTALDVVTINFIYKIECLQLSPKTLKMEINYTIASLACWEEAYHGPTYALWVEYPMFAA